MPKSLLSAFEGRPLLDIRSWGRQGPGRRDHIPSADMATMRRTLNRDPEVMVKVISKGAQDLHALETHLKYLGREGEVDLLDDQGQSTRDPDAGKALIEDWNLDLQDSRRSLSLKLSSSGTKEPAIFRQIGTS